MASWGEAKLFFCLLFITCCCTMTSAEVPRDCCLSVKNKEVKKILVVDYSRQISGGGCSIDATVLVTRGGRKLCVPADESWIQAVMKHVDHLKKRCKSVQYKGQHCKGVIHE
ncbi:C-C motif chemokine 19-like [Anoplopoma fimbria]|uniref:C-C motif chemokine 19 n=1 Tax=Anoplopoma fimbria TaxID=229290 RepID=C3KGZ7_ANOFI|nr:C-C motif chemokine 19-like [Anoplopoma fimbria]ACQ57919.1 C-C motif chemokine 19 precursor [Anoplopoma fimbria]